MPPHPYPLCKTPHPLCDEQHSCWHRGQLCARVSSCTLLSSCQGQTRLRRFGLTRTTPRDNYATPIAIAFLIPEPYTWRLSWALLRVAPQLYREAAREDNRNHSDLRRARKALRRPKGMGNEYFKWSQHLRNIISYTSSDLRDQSANAAQTRMPSLKELPLLARYSRHADRVVNAHTVLCERTR